MRGTTAYADTIGDRRRDVMDAALVAPDGPSGPVRHAVALCVVMSEAEVELWQRLAEQLRLEVDDVVHAVALGGLKAHLTQAGDESGRHLAAGCEREVLARLGLDAGDGAPRPRRGSEPH
jgi:hypothetical protein